MIQKKQIGVLVLNQRNPMGHVKPGIVWEFRIAIRYSAVQSRLILIDRYSNFAEFKLRLYHGDSLLYTFPVRIGQNKISEVMGKSGGS